jgi:retinol-binding protein 3
VRTLLRPTVSPIVSLLLFLAGLTSPPDSAFAQPTRRELPPLTAADRAAIVADLGAAIARVYVFPEVAETMRAHLERQLAAGAYDALGAAPELAQRLTEELQAISKDLHLRVRVAPEPPAGAGGPGDAEREQAFAEQMRRDNYCFEKLERLAGNVGYLRLDCFAPAELGGATAVAAMAFLAGSDALIFDLRQNGGGDPSMIQLLTSYLVGPDAVHLNSFYVRDEDRTRQFWTQDYVPGARRPAVPVYVLTSRRTFSAAEEFSYNLRNLERATLVGETTGGGAHPVRFHRVPNQPIGMMLPFGRAINPITGTNWEGSGVEPHLRVDASAALDVAHREALRALEEKATDPAARAQLAFVRGVLADRERAVELSREEMEAYVGAYGPREITLDAGGLSYRRGEAAWQRLVPVGDDRFLVADLLGFRLRFERDGEGRVTRLVGIYEDGREEPSERTR